jgi:hypothetical protein
MLSNPRRSIFRRGDRRVGEIPQERPPEDTPALSHARPTTAALGVPCAKPHRPAGEAPSNRNSNTSSCRRGGNQDEGSASWPPCSAHTRHGTFKLVNGHVEVNVNVSRSRKDWVRLLLDRLKLANDSSHPCFDITSHGLEIHRHPWRPTHHDRPPEKNAPKPTGNPEIAHGDRRVSSLTIGRHPRPMPGARAMLSPWFALGAGWVCNHPSGPASPLWWGNQIL